MNCKPYAGLRPCTPPGISSLDPIAKVVGVTNKQLPAVASIRQQQACKREAQHFRLAAALPHTHGPGGGTPPTGCCASGFSLFSLRPWALFPLPKVACGKKFGRSRPLQRRLGAGGIPLPWGYRGRGAPCLVRSSPGMRKKVCLISFLYRRTGAGPMALLPGVQGAA